MSTKAELLQEAKERIESGQVRTICYALGKTDVGPWPAVEAVLERIRGDLSPHPSLIEWTKYQGYYIQSQNHKDLARMAWIDKLIEEFSHEH